MSIKFKLFKLLLQKSDAVCSRRDGEDGFTLTELLIVVIIGSLIVATLMALVVQLVSTEQRESARTETQREMQLALDFIASDLRQAVHVYDEPSYLPYLPNNLQQAADYRPVVAFWKPKPIDPSAIGNYPDYSPTVTDSGCGTDYSGDATLRAECNNLWLQRRTYSLVVYFETSDDGPEPEKWPGKSRIVRYELDKYADLTKTGAARFQRNPGYVDPGELEGFDLWPLSGGKNCQLAANPCKLSIASKPHDADVVPPTLVDFVDTSKGGGPGEARRALDFPTGADACAAGYKMQPEPDQANNPYASFFMCIREDGSSSATTTASTSNDSNDIRDIQLYLRGNVGERLGGAGNADIPLDAMRTQLTMRGVIDKKV